MIRNPKALLAALAKGGVTTLGGVPDGFDAFVFADCARALAGAGREGSALIVHIARDGQRAQAFVEALAFAAPEIEALHFPGWDCQPYDRVSPTGEIAARRMTVLSRLARTRSSPERPRILSTTVNAVLQRVPPLSWVAGTSFSAAPGNAVDLNALVQWLELNGFLRSSTVRDTGDYAVRGGIVDLFAPGMPAPARLDFFGDTLESIRSFDPESQRTVLQLRSLDLVPMSEVQLTTEVIKRFRQGYVAAFGGATRDDALYEAVSEGRRHAGLEHWLPLFHARLSLNAGASQDPAGKSGLAQFTADLLRRGTGQHTADELDVIIEGMGASLSVECSADESALSLTVPADLAEPALDVLLEVALTPAFADQEVESARRRALAALQSDLDEAGTVASRALVALGFGALHPYGHPTQGYSKHLASIGRADALLFHAARYRPQGALLAVVGEGEPARLLEFARQMLERWQPSWQSPMELAAPVWPPAASRALQAGAPLLRALVVHKPDSTQAQVRIVSPGLPKRTARYAEAVVANTALGGGFTSVLVDAIRVDRGLSYSVASRLLMYRHAGLSVFASFTKNETLRALIDVALDKMRGYAATGPSAEALEKVRPYLAGLYPLGIESHEALAESVADAILDGVGLQHLQTYRSRVLSVTPEAVRAAAADLSPARPGARLVIVGDAEVAQRALEGLCPVEVRQLEEFA